MDEHKALISYSHKDLKYTTVPHLKLLELTHNIAIRYDGRNLAGNTIDSGKVLLYI